MKQGWTQERRDKYPESWEKVKLMLQANGQNMSPETKQRMRENKNKARGEKHGNWAGGNWRYWSKQALIRDNYICQICGMREPDIMEVDHIKPKSKYPELKFILENLMTLCPNCHRRKTVRDIKNKFT